MLTRDVSLSLYFFIFVSSAAGAQEQTGTIPKDTECGLSKGCFSDRARSFQVTWQANGDAAVYTIKSQSQLEQYFALGFSTDQRMGSDKVIGCAVTQSSTVLQFTSETQGRSSSPILNKELTISNATFKDGLITCELVISKVLHDWVNVSRPWYLLVARGFAVFQGEGSNTIISAINEHHGGDNKFSSNATASAFDYLVLTTPTRASALVKAHGCLMVIAWMFFTSLGVIVARYYKPVWSHNLLSQKVWFQVHRFCMMLVVVCTALGFVLIFVEKGGWVDLDDEDSYLKSHPILGVIVMVLTILNPLMALCRPAPKTPKRPVFNWLHLLVGEGTHVLGVITIFFGVELYEKSPASLLTVLAVAVSWHILVETVLMSLKCFCSDKQEDTFQLETGLDGEELMEESGFVWEEFVGTHFPEAFRSISSARFKTGILGVHVLVALGLTIALCAIIA